MCLMRRAYAGENAEIALETALTPYHDRIGRPS